MRIWELRFTDGRGASVFTRDDVTDGIGALGETRRITVAFETTAGREIQDARRCFEGGEVVELVAHLGAIAYAVIHEA